MVSQDRELLNLTLAQARALGSEGPVRPEATHQERLIAEKITLLNTLPSQCFSTTCHNCLPPSFSWHFFFTLTSLFHPIPSESMHRFLNHPLLFAFSTSSHLFQNLESSYQPLIIFFRLPNLQISCRYTTSFHSTRHNCLFDAIFRLPYQLFTHSLYAAIFLLFRSLLLPVVPFLNHQTIAATDNTSFLRFQLQFDSDII